MSKTKTSRRPSTAKSGLQRVQAEPLRAGVEGAGVAANGFAPGADDEARSTLALVSPDALTEEELMEYLGRLQERAHQELSKPFMTWADFTRRLGQIKRACKRGCFDSQLRAVTTNLYAYLKEVKTESLSKEDLPLYWKGRSVLYELNDIFHLDNSDLINQWTYDDGERIYDELEGLKGKWKTRGAHSEVDYQLVKEKIIFCTYYAHELKRRNDTDTCLKRLQSLLDFVTNEVKTEDVRCLGTRANLCYHLGAVYRLLEQHDDGESMYAQAIELYYERKKRRPANDHDDHSFTTRRIAMCIGLGFGWQNLTRGYLRRAENALAAARSMLANSSDPVVPPYIELLYGTIRRCRAGNNEVEIRGAIESLQQARIAFKNHNHSRYEARASWELALCFNLVKDFDEAETHLAVVEAYARKQGHLTVVEDNAEKQGDLKWLANVHCLRSRIHRGRELYQQALEEAEVACNIAKDSKHLLPEVDALITRGEANFYLSEATDQQDSGYDKARADFETALQMLQKQEVSAGGIGQTLNPKIASVCALRIAQCFARTGEEAKAKSHFAEWELVSLSIEHGWVQDLAREVQNEIKKMSESFTISARDCSKWNYSKQVRRLRTWLYTRAMNQTNYNWAEAAKLIGVERATLYQWRYPANQRVQRARTTKRKEPDLPKKEAQIS